MTDERDAKRFVGALEKYAAMHSEEEQKHWRKYADAFGYKWISTPTEIRQCLINAALAADSVHLCLKCGKEMEGVER